ncbi:hypothetical protein K435DRAFT_855120 [Dendrothele bispora CBS 962.96]|uniref:Uncharacterized protein n=1 Tax=Dendrothele bispora (strain CBS 962.96) TaxID=1314807 RepID=A0A4S8MD65_DENBC|nr:hypothetical protein K435DRAFT_855120 [Dendrothele bispora CBS 962.96]
MAIFNSSSFGVSEENGSANNIQTGIPTPLGVQGPGESSACEDHPDFSGPRTQGKEDQQATPAADGDQTSKSGRGKEQRRGEGGAGRKVSTAVAGNEEYGGRHTDVGPESDILIRPIEEPI